MRSKNRHLRLILAAVIAATALLLMAFTDGSAPAQPEGGTQPTEAPTEAPSIEPTEAPSIEPTEAPSIEPTEAPSIEPTEAPSIEPTEAPSIEPTEAPSIEPTEAPSIEPTQAPSIEPTQAPSTEPTEVPSIEPTKAPTAEPTAAPTDELAEDEARVSCMAGETEVPVRESADGQSPILFALPDETVVKVLGIEGDWVMIGYQDSVGYVYKDNLPSVEIDAPEEERRIPKVTIFSSRSNVMELGETVTLTSRLEYAQGYELRYQWQCDRGSGFEAIEGANGDTYSFAAAQDTLSYDWRLIVYYR